MAPRTHTYAIRLAVEGGGHVKAELVLVGQSGEQSLKRIETAGDKASGGLKGLGRQAELLRTGIRTLRGPLIGAATVGGLAALVDRSISALDAIGKTADKIGVGVEALGLLHQPGLQRRHRPDPVLRRLLDEPNGPPLARRSLRLPAPLERGACAHGECATRHAALDRHGRRHLPDGIASATRRTSGDVQEAWSSVLESPMSQAAVHRPPARFDASVLPGAKPAPFPGFVEPSHPTLREKAPSGERRCTRSSSTVARQAGHPSTRECLHQAPWGAPRPSRGFEVLAPSRPGTFCKARTPLQRM